MNVWGFASVLDFAGKNELPVCALRPADCSLCVKVYIFFLVDEPKSEVHACVVAGSGGKSNQADDRLGNKIRSLQLALNKCTASKQAVDAMEWRCKRRNRGEEDEKGKTAAVRSTAVTFTFLNHRSGACDGRTNVHVILSRRIPLYRLAQGFFFVAPVAHRSPTDGYPQAGLSAPLSPSASSLVIAACLPVKT